MKIMVIEDDMIIAKELEKVLQQWQFETVVVENFQNIATQFTQEQPHLILLDINLPVFNGYYWCGELRKLSNVPIMFISSLTDKIDMMMAIQMGADDYITKPFDIQLTLSKIQALLRRTYEFSSMEQKQVLQYQYKSLAIDIDKMLLLNYESNKTVTLTFTELQIVKALFNQAEKFVTRETLLDVCWENDQFIDDNTLAVNMTRIRKKMSEVLPEGGKWIETKKKVGYRLIKLQN